MPYPTLKKAPIREAIIDLQFSAEIPYEVVERVSRALRPSFAKTETLKRGQIAIQIDSANDPMPPVMSSEVFGVRLENEGRTKIAQLRRNGFTLSYVGYYTVWDEFSAQARSLWSQFGEKLQDTILSRVATRYINQIHLPAGQVDLDKFLTSGPKIPAGLPQGLSGFLSRLVIPMEAESATAIVTQALETPTPQTAQLILDIDVFCGVEFAPTDERIWDKLAVLRELKNRIFFTFLTAEAMETYK